MGSDSIGLAAARPQTHRAHGPGRPRGTMTALIACSAAIIPLAAACSSSHPPVSAGTSKTCAQVAAVLSDGPDPGQDQVGYAEAQILPLRQVRAATPALRSAISDLADAYARFFASNGKSATATRAVAVAAAHMNKLCPGAGAAA
jgi:hypothetical protein